MKNVLAQSSAWDDDNRPNGYLHCWTDVQMLGYCISFFILIIYIAE